MGGKHSARAMQLAVKYYKDSGGTYSGTKKNQTVFPNGVNKIGKLNLENLLVRREKDTCLKKLLNLYLVKSMQLLQKQNAKVLKGVNNT